jgi:molybdopterin-guanine dinucleotide biosynthesis protein B
MNKTQKPVICVVGKSKVGKTSFLEKLILELKQRHYRVGTIKHYHGEFEIDRPGKDTWRHAYAGADAVVISTPKKAALIKKLDQELPVDQIIPLLGEVDLVLAAGYKKEDYAQIEVCHPDITKLPSSNKLLAQVNCIPQNGSKPAFRTEDIQKIANLIEEKFLLS